MLQALAMRLRHALVISRLVLTAPPQTMRRLPPPPPLAFALCGDYPQQQDEELEEEEDEWIRLMAVPKRRVSHRRKRIKFDQKHLKPLQSLVACPSCGEKHPQYYQLCPFCQPFNNFIKTKDAPVKEYDRVKRVVEAKILEKLLVEQEQTIDEDAKPLTTKEDTRKKKE